MRSPYYCYVVNVQRLLFVAHMKLPSQPPTAYSAPLTRSQKFEEGYKMRIKAAGAETSAARRVQPWLQVRAAAGQNGPCIRFIDPKMLDDGLQKAALAAPCSAGRPTAVRMYSAEQTETSTAHTAFICSWCRDQESLFGCEQTRGPFRTPARRGGWVITQELGNIQEKKM